MSKADGMIRVVHDEAGFWLEVQRGDEEVIRVQCRDEGHAHDCFYMTVGAFFPEPDPLTSLGGEA